MSSRLLLGDLRQLGYSDGQQSVRFSTSGSLRGGPRAAFHTHPPRTCRSPFHPFPTSFLLSYTAKIGLILRDDTYCSTPHRFRPPPRVRKSRGDALPGGKAALLGRKAARRIQGGGPADFLPLDSGPSGPRFPNPRRNRAHTRRSGREFAAHAAAISLAALGASSSKSISARS